MNNALAPLSEPAELQKCVLSDSLITMSQGGQDLGNFSMTVDFGRKGQQSCMLLHALSQGAIDGSPCGTSVTGELRARACTCTCTWHVYLLINVLMFCTQSSSCCHGPGGLGGELPRVHQSESSQVSYTVSSALFTLLTFFL